MRKAVVIVGGGARTAEKEVKKYLKNTGFPFVATWAALDMFTHDYPNHIGTFGITGSKAGNKAVQEADFLLVLGSRLDTHQTGSDPSKFAPKAYTVVVDIDPTELNKKNDLHIAEKLNMTVKEFINEYSKSLQVYGRAFKTLRRRRHYNY